MLHATELEQHGRGRKSAGVARHLLGLITRGEVGPGERLPSERALAESMGVSRGVVREALSVLEISGLLDVRTGDGTFVKRGHVSDTSIRELDQVIEGSESPLELWEARGEIESSVIGLAALRATESNHVDAAAALNAMRDAEGVERYLAANDAFHRSLMEACDNSLLRRIGADLIDRMGAPTVRVPVSRYLSDVASRSLEVHQAIFDAFCARDLVALRRAILNHFKVLEVYFLEH